MGRGWLEDIFLIVIVTLITFSIIIIEVDYILIHILVTILVSIEPTLYDCVMVLTLHRLCHVFLKDLFYSTQPLILVGNIRKF